MNIYEKGLTTVTESSEKDQLHCVISGKQTWYVLSAWERSKMRIGQTFPHNDREIKSIMHSPVDLRLEFELRTHVVHLGAGDCIFMNAYWWY